MKRFYVAPTVLLSMQIMGETIYFGKTDWGRVNGLVGVQPVFKTKKQAKKFYNEEPIVIEEVHSNEAR